ncbi:MAG: CRTAC1 family protein [Myxococcota bacterium]
MACTFAHSRCCSWPAAIPRVSLARARRPAGPRRRPKVEARVEASKPRHCEAPTDREALGPFRSWVAEGTPASRAWLSGGLLAGDLDSDGYLDVVTPLEQEARLFRGRPNNMAPYTERLSGFDLSEGTGGSLADVDGDGDLDLLVLRYDAPAVLLRNDGRGHFQDVSAALPIAVSGPTTSSAWADIDLDGDLDLFVGSYGYVEDEDRPARSYLFENEGDGTFTDRSAELPEVLHQGYTRVGGFHDLDGDGYPELYVVNDVGSVAPNVLLRNHYGHFYLDEESGLDLQMAGGGLGVGDIDGDDVPDLLIPQWDDLSLMLSGPGGRWIESAPSRNLIPGPDQRVGWGAELADLDNDGDLDAIVEYGTIAEPPVPGWDNPEHQPDALFLQQDDGTFIDVAAEWGVADDGKNRGVIVADFDGDGWLDLAKRDLDGPSTMYVSRCGENHWLEVRLGDPGVRNRSAVGARVRVFGEDGDAWSRWITAGGTGYGTGGPPIVHFGLGPRERIDHIEVRWPDGAESVVAEDFGVDQLVTITRE